MDVNYDKDFFVKLYVFIDNLTILRENKNKYIGNI